MIRGLAVSHPLTILAVEDEPLVRELIVDELEDAGFVALAAETGDAALPILQGSRRIDVLFTDIRLPGTVDGWQLAKAARRLRPYMPVIYATGYTVERASQVPGGLFFSKPYQPSAIIDAIRALCPVGA